MRFQPTITALLAAGALAAAFGLGTVGEKPERATPGTAPVAEAAADAQVTAKTGDHGVVVGDSDVDVDHQSGFAVNAFPPTLPDQKWHQNAWRRQDCMDCHETGVQDAPIVRHIGLPALAKQVKCRWCHVLIPGKTEARPASERPPEVNDEYASWAFPPMMPNNSRHRGAWGKNQCLVCHEEGVRGAPKVNHDPGLPRLALMVKCRSCHVQVRSNETSPWDW